MLYRFFFFFISVSVFCWGRGEPVILLFGPPGAGKGTFSQLAKEKGYQHLSTGDMIRDEIAHKTPFGIKAEEIVKRGEYLEPMLIWAMVKEKLGQFARDQVPFILDGYGKTPKDMDVLFEMLKEFGMDDSIFVLFLQADHETCKNRIFGRLVCNQCHYVCNMQTEKISNGEPCPKCRLGFLQQRINDTPSVIEKRILQYRLEIEENHKKSLDRFPGIIFDSGQPEKVCRNFYIQLLENPTLFFD